MNKRFRLITSISLCCLCIAMLSFAVYAAASLISFNISASMSFNPNNCYVEITGTISGEGITNASTYSYTTDGTDSYPEWDIGNLNLINSITIQLTFKNYSTYPVEIGISGVESGSNYTGTIANNNITLQTYVLDQTPDSDTITITYKLAGQSAPVNISNINITTNIEKVVQTFTYTYSLPNGLGILNNIALYDDGVEVEITGTSGSFQVEDGSVLTLVERSTTKNKVSSYDIQFAPGMGSLNFYVYNTESEQVLWGYLESDFVNINMGSYTVNGK